MLEKMLSLSSAKNGMFFLGLISRLKRTRRFWMFLGHVGAMLGLCWAYVGRKNSVCI